MTDDRKTIWKRRVALMAIVALVIAVPVTLIVRAGDDDGDDVDSDDNLSAQPAPVGEAQFLRDLGVELRLPEGWRLKEKDGVVSLRSADRRAVIAISAPGPAEDHKQIHEEAVNGLRVLYRDVKVVDEIKNKTLGGIKSDTSVVTARSPEDDVEFSIYVSTAKGEKVAYLVEVFATGSDAANAIVQAQTLLNNLTLKG